MYITSYIPQTLTGYGSFEIALQKIKGMSTDVLICISNYHFNSEEIVKKIDTIFGSGVNRKYHIVSGEPNPYDVDKLANNLKSNKIDLIIAIGGGSVIDFAKALSAILPLESGSVFDYLEGVGNGKTYTHTPLYLVAVPTTPGTGAEVTKNAVLSVTGVFKKSFRDDSLIPKMVVLDPSFLYTLPTSTLAATAMDGLTQLIESYTSTQSNSFVDTLIEAILPNLTTTIKKIKSQTLDSDDYMQLMLMGYYSGIALANCGLGIVHSFASPIGAYTEAGHGVICARLLAPTTDENIKWLEDNGHDTLRYERFAKLSSNTAPKEFVHTLYELVEYLEIPELGSCGLNDSLIEKIVQEVSKKTNPADLGKDILIAILSKELSA